MSKVFLGGTCNNSKWREKLIPMLKVDYFNPVVDDWTEECYQEELRQREMCDYCLYVITPRMNGVYSIAEVINDSNKRPAKTIFCILDRDFADDDKILPHDLDELDEAELYFDEDELKSLDKVGKMVKRNGGKYFNSLEEVANYLNKKMYLKSLEGVKDIEKWIEEGHKVLSHDKWEEWDKVVPIRASDLYEGMELSCTLFVEEILKKNTEDSFKQASAELDSQNHSEMSYSLMKAMIKTFCTNGEEFVKYLEK